MLRRAELKLRKSFDSPWYCLLIMAVAGLFLLGLIFRAYHGDASRFLHVGGVFSTPSSFVNKIRILNYSGYDGQFYYRLALNPFNLQEDSYGVRIDSPVYREQRIMYPVIVWLLSLGQHSLVPYMMIFVNFIAFCAIGWLGGWLAQSFKQHALWGLLFGFFPGFIVALSFNLTEILTACFLLAGLALLRYSKYFASSLFFILAVLTRETSVVAVAIILFILFFQKKSWQYFLIPSSVWLLWQSFLWHKWGLIPFLAAQSSTSWPFAGLADKLFSVDIMGMNWVGFFVFWWLIFIILISLLLVFSWRNLVIKSYEKFLWLPYLLLSSLVATSFVDINGFLRVFTEFYLFGVVILINLPQRVKLFLFSMVLMLWSLSLYHMGYF